MTSKNGLVLALVLLACTALAPAAHAGEHSLGFGYHYWQTIDGLDDIDTGTLDDVKDNGNSYVFAYQYIPRGFFKFEVDLEVYPDGFAGSSERAYSPQVFALVGGFVYGGVGVGVISSDGLEDDPSDPFYMARIGLDLAVLGSISIDIHARYDLGAWDQIDDIEFDTDSFTLGAVARVRF